MTMQELSKKWEDKEKELAELVEKRIQKNKVLRIKLNTVKAVHPEITWVSLAKTLTVSDATLYSWRKEKQRFLKPEAEIILEQILDEFFKEEKVQKLFSVNY